MWLQPHFRPEPEVELKVQVLNLSLQVLQPGSGLHQHLQHNFRPGSAGLLSRSGSSSQSYTYTTVQSPSGSMKQCNNFYIHPNGCTAACSLRSVKTWSQASRSVLLLPWTLTEIASLDIMLEQEKP